MVVGGEVENGRLSQCVVKSLCVTVMSLSFVLWAEAALQFVRYGML